MTQTPMLQLMLERLGGASASIRLVVATSDQPSDDPICKLCNKLGIAVVRGPLQDVLARYIAALDAFEPKIAMRMTGDCPFSEPRLLGCGMKAFEQATSTSAGLVGASNHLADRRDPLGYGVEVFMPDKLRWLADQDLVDAEREHVTLGFKRRGLYGSFDVLGQNLSHMRWTVDTPADFVYMERMFDQLGQHATASQAIAWSRSNPHPDSAS